MTTPREQEIAHVLDDINHHSHFTAELMHPDMDSVPHVAVKLTVGGSISEISFPVKLLLRAPDALNHVKVTFFNPLLVDLNGPPAKIETKWMDTLHIRESDEGETLSGSVLVRVPKNLRKGEFVAVQLADRSYEPAEGLPYRVRLQDLDDDHEPVEYRLIEYVFATSELERFGGMLPSFYLVTVTA